MKKALLKYSYQSMIALVIILTVTICIVNILDYDVIASKYHVLFPFIFNLYLFVIVAFLFVRNLYVPRIPRLIHRNVGLMSKNNNNTIYTEKEEEIFFEHRHYLAIYILIDEAETYENTVQDGKILINTIRSVLLKSGIASIGKCITKGEFSICLASNQKFLLEGNKDLIEKAGNHSLLHPLRQLSEAIYKITGHTITIGVGNSVTFKAKPQLEDLSDNVIDINESMQVAKKRAMRRIILGKNQVIDYEEDGEKGYLLLECAKQITQVLESENVEKLTEFFASLKSVISMHKDSISVEQAQTLISYLSIETFKYASKGGVVDTSFYNIITSTSHFETIDDAFSYFIKAISNLLQDKVMKRKGEMQLVQYAATYISENFNKDIDVNTIAENIGISYSRLRKHILDNFGLNIVDYINELRIKKSKELLATTDLTIVEIASTVGYNNAQSFSRYFKKFTNNTPGKYRNEVQRQKENVE